MFNHKCWNSMTFHCPICFYLSPWSNPLLIDIMHRTSKCWWSCYTPLLLINQTPNAINQNKPMGLTWYKTIHDEDMAFAMVTHQLYCISIFRYSPIVSPHISQSFSHHFPISAVIFPIISPSRSPWFLWGLPQKPSRPPLSQSPINDTPNTPYISRWWFQPCWKISVSWEYYSQYTDNKNM